MMSIFYNVGIYCYQTLLFIAALLGNGKAKSWIEGRKDIFKIVASKINTSDSIIWFHCASVGEFEQARVLLEKIKKNIPTYKILLTFFSPSGYELRKNYAFADYIFYLPMDTPSNARRFVKLVNPKLVFFIKYEFWLNYIFELSRKNIPLIGVSYIFRDNQHFFKWYGTYFRKALRCYNMLFVQDENSKKLLKQLNMCDVEVVGDTRFDRVKQVADRAQKLDIVENFCSQKFTIVAGSTWSKDEDLFVDYIRQTTNTAKRKFVIVPHEVTSDHITEISAKLEGLSFITYSQAKMESVSDFDILLVDQIGFLSSIYRYASAAYIGGGFGTGIHNTLEAAVYGIPIAFGPKYHKFNEAKDLVSANIATVIASSSDLKLWIDRTLNDNVYYVTSSIASKEYVNRNVGASDIIFDRIQKYIC
ncbi:MAG: 3-deoxy-D-manno-octulosonic acid transferase [Bacteroidetes bacterium]|nr:3-deoxy-D-manno-octulosonic acid transferase [Bacteroidota bacterium]